MIACTVADRPSWITRRTMLSWKPCSSDPLERRRPFWDYRPFTRIVVGRRGFQRRRW